MIEKLNKYLDGKRKYLLVTLNVALLIFVILRIFDFVQYQPSTWIC